LNELKANPTKKPADISSVQIWRKKGEELKTEELNVIKEIVSDLREEGKLDNILPGKNGNHIHIMIMNCANRSNPEKKRQYYNATANWRQREENKAYIIEHREHNRKKRKNAEE
jgi:hypothetical protein